MSKTIMITGATSGIGLESAKYLFNNGYNVVLVGRDKDKLKSVSESLDNCLFYVLDLEMTSSIHEIFDYLQSNDIKLDGLVHAAGYAINMPIRAYSIEHMKKQMDIHYYAFAELCKNFYSKRVSNEGSSIVVLSSLSSMTKLKGSVLYASSKSAVNTEVSVISREFVKRKIRVNAILPAYVDTRMNTGLGELIDIEERQPWGMIPPLEVAFLIEYLLSDKSKSITGSLIPISAGMEF